ncbi:MAG: radical SAM protein, partial [Opitutales bacterium]
MKVLLLDPYPKRPWRISKDTSGGYGTANRFGDGLVSRLITWVMAREVDWPPLYCVHTAGVLVDQGHEVEYSRHFDAQKKYDLCLVTSSIVSHETEVAAVAAVAAAGIPVGVIGPLATTISEPYVNVGGFVIAGEPEMYFWKNPIKKESVAELSGVISSGDAVPLDDLPLPAWELVFKSSAPKFGLLGGGRVMLPIAATRGCPYSCSHYCVYPLQQGNKVRLRDAKKIVAEMEHWSDKLGITYFIFRDPVFSINRKHTLKLCEALEESSYKFKFMIETHLNNMDEELAIRLKKSGLEMVKVGIEATSKDTIEQSKRFS